MAPPHQHQHQHRGRAVFALCSTSFCVYLLMSDAVSTFLFRDTQRIVSAWAAVLGKR